MSAVSGSIAVQVLGPAGRRVAGLPRKAGAGRAAELKPHPSQAKPTAKIIH